MAQPGDLLPHRKRRKLAASEPGGKQDPESTAAPQRAAACQAGGKRKCTLRGIECWATSRPRSRRRGPPGAGPASEAGLQSLVLVGADADMAASLPAAKSQIVARHAARRRAASPERACFVDSGALKSLLLLLLADKAGSAPHAAPVLQCDAAAEPCQRASLTLAAPAQLRGAPAPGAARADSQTGPAAPPAAAEAPAEQPRRGNSAIGGISEPSQSPERLGRGRARSRKPANPRSSDPERSVSPARGQRGDLQEGPQGDAGCRRHGSTPAPPRGRGVDRRGDHSGGRAATPARPCQRKGLPPAKPCPWMPRAGASRSSGTFTVIVGWPGPRARDPVFVAAARAALEDLIRRRGSARTSW